jgi:hypothetical protein
MNDFEMKSDHDESDHHHRAGLWLLYGTIYAIIGRYVRLVILCL